MIYIKSKPNKNDLKWFQMNFEYEFHKDTKFHVVTPLCSDHLQAIEKVCLLHGLNKLVKTGYEGFLIWGTLFEKMVLNVSICNNSVKKEILCSIRENSFPHTVIDINSFEVIFSYFEDYL